jgi:hypothetical protein
VQSTARDERQQLADMRARYGRNWLLDVGNIAMSVFAGLFMIQLIIVLIWGADVANEAFDLWPTSIWDEIIFYGTVVTFLLLLMKESSKLIRDPELVCPHCKKKASALFWRCECGKEHRPLPQWVGRFWWGWFGNYYRTLADKCRGCKRQPSHYVCPHCDQEITLDASLPRSVARARSS